METDDIKRRLAAHAVESEEAPEGAQDQDVPASVAVPDEPALKTVADVLRYTMQPSAVVIGLKRIGALREDGETLVYKLQEKLGPPPPNTVDEDPNLKQLRFATRLTGYHIRRMRSFGEGVENAVAMNRVEALAGVSSAVTDRLSYIDSYAVMSIAAAIVADAGNV